VIGNFWNDSRSTFKFNNCICKSSSLLVVQSSRRKSVSLWIMNLNSYSITVEYSLLSHGHLVTSKSRKSGSDNRCCTCRFVIHQTLNLYNLTLILKQLNFPIFTCEEVTNNFQPLHYLAKSNPCVLFEIFVNRSRGLTSCLWDDSICIKVRYSSPLCVL